MNNSLAISRWAKVKQFPLSICLLACCIQLTSINSSAQYTKLLDFAGAANGTYPFGSLISDGTFLYGMTYWGGTNDEGTIFKILPDGTGYAKLLDFAGAANGSEPRGSLISDGTFLYGMTSRGGTVGLGTIFKIMPNGTGYAKLLDFDGTANGSSPQGSLISDGTFLYGMTGSGGTNDEGTIFKILPNGTGYAKLLDFDGTTNGSSPQGSLISDGTFLYGMTGSGGTNGLGTIFKIMPNGTGFAKLLDFNGAANGRIPYGSLISDGTFLYGMTALGGTNNFGTTFKIMPDGTGYAKLLDFDGSANGSDPLGSPIFDGTFLYGMTQQGGTNDLGTIFRIMPDGTGYTKLLDFDGAINGSYPEGSLISDGVFLYGVTASGGTNDMGTVFKYSIAPPVPTITNFTPASGPIGTTVIITGTNFSATPGSNIVFFGATQATVTAATSTQLTVTVPVGATYQPISVLVNGLTAFSGKAFITTFPDGGVIDACSFAAKVDVTTGSAPYSVAIGDLDADGKPDLAVVNETSNTVSVYKNISTRGSLSSSSFAAKIDFATGAEPYFVTIQDLDGDGKPELIVTNNDADKVSIYKNNTSLGVINSSSFAAKVDFSTGENPWNATIADFDLDGKPDLAIVNDVGNSVSILKNTSSIGTIDATSFAAKVDFATGNFPIGIACGDLDGDGKVDLAVTNQADNSFSILRNTSTAGTINASSFAAKIDFPTGLDPYSVAIGDLDGDSKPEIAVDNYSSGSVSVFGNTSTIGSVTLSPKVDFISGAGSLMVSITDMDGDGKPDLSVTNGGAIISILKNQTTAPPITPTSFAPKVDFTTTSDSYGLAIGDLDGNGKPDLVGTNFNGTTASILRNTVSSLPAFTASTFSPTSGPVGTTVTITGINFSTTPLNNTVKFNGLVATVTASSSTSITAVVPVGTTTGSISIEIGCVTAFTVTPFTVTTGNTITITTQPSDATLCAGVTANFTTAATGTTNITYQWQFSTTLTGTYTDIANGGGYSNVTTASLSVNTTGNFGGGFYRASVNGDLAATVFSNAAELTVNAVPSTPTIGTTNLGCAPTNTTLNPSGASAGEEYKFYDVATGGNLLNSGLSFTTPSLTASTTYHISTYNTTTLCESVRVPAIVNVQSCNAPVVETSTSTAFIEGIVTIDLEPLITDVDDNLDPSTLQIITQPVSGAPASLNDFLLTIDYTGVPFPGTDNVEIEICDLTGICTQQNLAIELGGEIEVFNAVSPNNDGANDYFNIEYIELFPDTENNLVTIYNRWGDVVFEISDYNNTDRVFIGQSDNGKDLPSGTYFYKIEFNSGRAMKTGYLSLKR